MLYSYLGFKAKRLCGEPGIRGADGDNFAFQLDLLILGLGMPDSLEVCRSVKGFRTLKGPIRMRPVFLHKDERIEALMFVNMLALLVYSILEMKCQRRGLKVTGEAVLQRFAYLAAIYTTFVDGSVQLRVEELDTFQQKVVRALGQGWWPSLPGCSPPTLPERQVVLCPRWEKIPIPPLS